MALHLEIDRDRPIYQQIVAQIKHLISVGNLPAGTRLPPVRQLALDLGVARLTVHNAYMELQSAGWVEATVGRGTYVRECMLPGELINMHLSRPDRYYCADMHELSQLTTLRSLAYAVPDPALIPSDEFISIVNGLRREAASLLHYGEQEGDAPLRVEVAKLLLDRGIEVMPDDVLITTGASQALMLVAQTLVPPGGCVLVDQPIYHGQLKAFDALGIRAIGVPMDAEGPRLDVLDRLIIENNPAFFSTIPNFHNPTGVVMSDTRRRDLLALAHRHQLIIVEDDVFALLSYNGAPPLALRSLDKHDLVITLSSVSKVLAPGLRIGFVVAPPMIQRRLVNLKWAMELSGPILLQRALAEYLHTGRLKFHLRRVIPIYRERRDTLLRAVKRYMPAGVKWTEPSGGIYCWLELPEHGRFDDLYPAALQRGVAFTPNEAFFTEPDNKYHLRLCFGNQTPEVIDEAVALLAELIRERLPKQARKEYHHEYATSQYPLRGQYPSRSGVTTGG